MLRVTCPVVVGRDDERRALTGLLRACRSGEGLGAVLVGEAGIGKSRLVRTVCEQASAAGMQVLVGRGVEYQTDVPFRAVTEALVSTLRSTPVPDTSALRPYRAALAAIAPELCEAPDTPARVSPVVVGEAIVRLLAALGAAHGCVLVLEDLHWADPDTAEVVRYVVDNLAGERIALLATARPTPGRGWSLVRDVQDRRTATVMQLDPLDQAGITAMAAACLEGGVPDAVLTSLRASSGGVPFLVEEMLATWIHLGQLRRRGGQWVAQGLTRTVPASVDEAVHDRVVGLGPDGQAVIEAAAVLGRQFPWRLLPDLVGTDEVRVLSALRAAVDVQVLEPGGDGFRFRHALTRDAVLARLLRPQRALLCRRAVELLQRSADVSDDMAALAAELAASVDDTDEAGRLLVPIGRRAIQRGALTTAEEVLFRARSMLAPGSPVLVDVEDALVAALALAGKTDMALSVGADLLQRVASSPQAGVTLAETHVRLARAAAAAARWTSAAEHLSAARSLTATDDLAGRSAVDVICAHVALGTGDLAGAESLAGAAVAAAEAAGLPEVLCESLEVVGRCARQFDLARAERAFHRAAEVAQQHQLTVWHVRALHELGTVDLVRHGGARLGRLEHARRAAWESGALATAATVDLQLAAGLVTSFRHHEALEVARRGAALARQLGLRLVEAMAVAFEAAVHGQDGDTTELNRSCRRALALAPGHPDVEMIVHGQALAMHALLNGDRLAALDELERATEAARRTDAPIPAPFRGMWALLTEVEHGRGAEACAEVLATGGGVNVVIGAYLRYAEAVRRGRAGDRAEVERLVELADRALVELPWQIHLGHLIMAGPAIASSWGSPDRWLREALDFFDVRGATRLATRCRSLLREARLPVPRRSSGAEPVPADLRGFGVTPRELEVLRLLVEGLPNREIATRLFLSPRTVERHLANLSRKTGASNRTQLAAIAARMPTS